MGNASMTQAVEQIAKKLGPIQKAVLLSLEYGTWKAAPSHKAAKRLWWKDPRLVDHRHQTDNCWCLTPLGLQVRDHLRSQAP